MNDYKVTLWPSGEILTLNDEETLLNQLKKAGKKIKSSCGGCATCSDCMIVVKSGELNLTPQTFEELRLLGNVFHITKERLSCQTKITGDVTLDITAHDKSTSSSQAAPKGHDPRGQKATKTMLKKRETIEKAAIESKEKNQEKPSDTWYRHWDKESEDSNKPKKLGGNKKVKPFNFNEPENDETDK
jgi:ferredoxin